MAGTKQGGKAAAATNKAKYGEDFYVRLGAKGGSNGRTGGFWHAKYVLGDTEKISLAGAKGGAISRRGKQQTISR